MHVGRFQAANSASQVLRTQKQGKCADCRANAVLLLLSASEDDTGLRARVRSTGV